MKGKRNFFILIFSKKRLNAASLTFRRKRDNLEYRFSAIRVLSRRFRMQGYDDWTQEERDSFDAIAAEDGLTGRELWGRIKDNEENLNRWPAADRDALERLAAMAGVSPERFHREVSARIETTHATSQCLTIAEMKGIVTTGRHDSLPEHRRRHVDSCKFCQQLLQATDRSKSPDWDLKYRQAVEYFAARCGMTPEEFERERRIHKIFAGQATSECLTLEEITAGVEDSRQAHIDGCEFCQGLIEAMNRPINPEHQRQFVEEALKTARKQS